MQRKLNDSFIDQYSQRFSEKVCDDFFGSKTVISGKEILGLTPSKQVNFFVIKRLFARWQEEVRKLESPFFNYKDAEVKSALTKFMNVLSQKIEVAREHFEPLLTHATYDSVLLIADPSVYFNVEFDKQTSPTLAERWVNSSMKYIKVYVNEVNTALHQQVGLNLEQAGHNLSDFFAEIDLTAEMNKEINLLSVVSEIEPEYLFDLEETSLEETADMEEGMLSQEDEFILAQDGLGLTEEEETDLVEDEADIFADEDEGEDDLIEDFDDIEGGSSVDERAIEEEEEAELEKEEMSSLNERLAPEKPKTVNEVYENDAVTLSDHHQQRKVNSILGAISVNNKYMFTKELFDNDKRLFESAMNSLEGCKSFDDAVEVLVQNYARQHDWDMNSVEVKELLKIVFRKFR